MYLLLAIKVFFFVDVNSDEAGLSKCPLAMVVVSLGSAPTSSLMSKTTWKKALAKAKVTWSMTLSSMLLIIGSPSHKYISQR